MYGEDKPISLIYCIAISDRVNCVNSFAYLIGLIVLLHCVSDRVNCVNSFAYLIGLIVLIHCIYDRVNCVNSLAYLIGLIHCIYDGICNLNGHSLFK